MRLSEKTLADHKETTRDFVEESFWDYTREELAEGAKLLEAENDALKQELAIGQGFVLDYLLKGDADNELEPFYSWCKRVRALLEGSE